MGLKTFVDLVRDPNFNKFKYMKHVKLDDERLKCLTNKSIHIQAGPLLEIIALIVFNTDPVSYTHLTLPTIYSV